MDISVDTHELRWADERGPDPAPRSPASASYAGLPTGWTVAGIAPSGQILWVRAKEVAAESAALRELVAEVLEHGEAVLDRSKEAGAVASFVAMAAMKFRLKAPRLATQIRRLGADEPRVETPPLRDKEAVLVARRTQQKLIDTAKREEARKAGIEAGGSAASESNPRPIDAPNFASEDPELAALLAMLRPYLGQIPGGEDAIPAAVRLCHLGRHECGRSLRRLFDLLDDPGTPSETVVELATVRAADSIEHFHRETMELWGRLAPPSAPRLPGWYDRRWMVRMLDTVTGVCRRLAKELDLRATRDERAQPVH